MIHPVVPLIAYMSRYFTLKAGDVVLTGTPAGVGPLLSGDELDIFSWRNVVYSRSVKFACRLQRR